MILRSMGGFVSLGKLALFVLPIVGISISAPIIASRCTQPINTVITHPTVPLSYSIIHQADGSHNQGDTNIKVQGINGSEKQILKTEYKCKQVISKQVLSRTTIKQPVDEVLLEGNRHTTVEKENIPFSTKEVVDNSLSAGQQKVQTPGVDGTKEVTYTISQDQGQPEQKIKTDEKIISAPVDEVIGIGPQCDPNYSGCVPNVYPADVDCYYGSGNGPYYTHGPVRVIGVDRYGLDGNNDGWGCESG